MTEQEVREKIALQIEALQTWRDETGAVVVFKERALAVVRGTDD